jgi:4-aminobutyrate aminotransferase-like enzyme
MGALDPGQHTSTFLTNALTHAAAIAAIDVLIEEDLCRRSGALGEVLLSSLRVRLADHPHVGDVRGLGLFVGVELVADRKTREPAAKLAAEIQNRARNAGLIVGLSGYHNNVIKLAPPLVISREQIEIALSLLGEVLSDD